MHPNIIFPGTWDFFRPFLEACLYVGTRSNFQGCPQDQGKHLSAVSLCPSPPVGRVGARLIVHCQRAAQMACQRSSS